MDNLVAYHRELKEEAEGKLSQSMDDLKATSAELQKVSAELENVSTELKTTSGSLQIVSDELFAEKQASEVLNARLAAVEDKATGLELELVFSQSRKAELNGQLTSLSKDAIIAEYKASDDFFMEWMNKVLPYYDQGKFHVMRMAAAFGASPFQLFKWGEAEHYSEASRAFHHLIPYSDEELEVLKQREPYWSPPTPIAWNIPYLLEVVRCGGRVEMTPNG